MAGAALTDLDLPWGEAAGQRSTGQVSVKAAVLPFARFPGADPVLGPEMRSTGEVMATASDLPTAFAKAERAAGRPRRTRARSSSPFATRTSLPSSRSPQPSPTSASRLWPPRARPKRSGQPASVEPVAKVSEGGGVATVVDLIRRGRCDLVVNTPQGSEARSDGYLIREAALVARVPCITTIPGAAAAADAIANARAEAALSLQERHARNGGTHGSPLTPSFPAAPGRLRPGLPPGIARFARGKIAQSGAEQHG